MEIKMTIILLSRKILIEIMEKDPNEPRYSI